MRFGHGAIAAQLCSLEARPAPHPPPLDGRGRFLRFAFVTALLCACAAAPARAQSQPDITGRWLLEAPLEPDSACVIAGHAEIRALRGRSAYGVRLSVRETCPSGPDWRAEQLCRGAREADKLWIDCDVVSAAPEGYVDDDFALVIRSDTLMQGWLISARRGRAEWRRPARPLVS